MLSDSTSADHGSDETPRDEPVSNNEPLITENTGRYKSGQVSKAGVEEIEKNGDNEPWRKPRTDKDTTTHAKISQLVNKTCSQQACSKLVNKL